MPTSSAPAWGGVGKTFIVAADVLPVVQTEMHLTDDDITSIAEWTPINESFAVIVEPEFDSILRRIDESGTHTHRVFETGGLSNYVAFLVCRPDDLAHRPPETYRQLTQK